MIEVDELAIDSAWMPSCCLVCRACNFALSLARSASTRLPTPASRLSCSLPTKPRCEASDFDPVPSVESALADPELRYVEAVIAAALAWVPMVEVVSILLPVTASVMIAFPSDMSCATTVMN